jgi:hypothetical protein
MSQVSRESPETDSLDRPNHFCRRSTNLVLISPPSWLRMSSGARQRSQLRYSRSSTLSWMQRYMTHASLSLKLRRQSLHRRCRSPQMYHWGQPHLHYKLRGQTADHPRLDQPPRARAREQTESLAHSPGNTSASRSGTTSPFLPLRIHSSCFPIMSK